MNVGFPGSSYLTILLCMRVLVYQCSQHFWQAQAWVLQLHTVPSAVEALMVSTRMTSRKIYLITYQYVQREPDVSFPLSKAPILAERGPNQLKRSSSSTRHHSSHQRASNNAQIVALRARARWTSPTPWRTLMHYALLPHCIAVCVATLYLAHADWTAVAKVFVVLDVA